MTIAIANTAFDRVRYDGGADVLYLSVGDPEDAIDFDESPEGHHLRFGGDGRLVGVTIVRPRWLLDNEGQVVITIPERVAVDSDALGAALV
jgi:uncharacterized protein YuzE